MEIKPMLLTEVDKIDLSDKNKIYQIKENGCRAIIYVKGGKIVGIRGRSSGPMLYCFPELKDEVFDFQSGILDAEICVFDKNGKSIFYSGIDRRNKTVPDNKKLKEYPVVAVIFDILQFEDKPLIYTPYKDRLALLKEHIKNTEHVKLIESFTDGQALWDRVVKENLEGLIVKDPNGVYELGTRTKSQNKVKYYKFVDIIVSKTEVNPKGTKVYGKANINNVDVDVECQIQGKVVDVGSTVNVKYLDIIGNRLIQPTFFGG